MRVGDGGMGEMGRIIGDVLCIIGDVENGVGYEVRGTGKTRKPQNLKTLTARLQDCKTARQKIIDCAKQTKHFNSFLAGA
jgi:hypothetical protein